MKKLNLIYVVVFLLLVTNAFAQAPDTLWTRTYGGAGKDKANSVQQTTDGGYIIVGSTESMGTGAYLIKTDADGNELWTQFYEDMSGEMKKDVKQTTDGGYIISGDGNMAVRMIKTDENGNIIWNNSYDETNGDMKTDVQQTVDGGYILTCFVFEGYNAAFYLLKTDSDGVVEWEWTGNGPGSYMDVGEEVLQTDDGGFIACGFTAPSLNDAIVVRMDADGDTLWTRTYGGNLDDIAFSIAEAGVGCYVIAGYTKSFGAGEQDFYLVKIDDSGNELWSQTYGGLNADEAYSVKQTTDGGFIIVGETQSFNSQYRDIYIVKTDNNGDMLWSKIIGGPQIETGWCVQQTDDDRYIIAGMTQSYGAGDFDFYVVKLDVDPVSVDDWTIVPQYSQINSIYPNPFNTTTTISFNLSTELTENTELIIYNLKGQKVKMLINDKLPTGKHSVMWDGRDDRNKTVASGLYFCTMKSGDYSSSKKMILMK
ncbi:MAG: T9SS type A sorting domain-containing protein [Bacteroidales bacterium]|nr:T9SS type A sorting domain-containing protein [Bacteroidales bacterium]